jgi:hypothetical protein
MTTEIKSAIARLKSWRDQASPSPWEIQVEDGHETIWLDDARELPPTIYDLNFIDQAANNWTNILNALEKSVEALEKIKNLDFEDTNIVDYGDGEERTSASEICGKYLTDIAKLLCSESREDEDPTLWCNACGAATRKKCNCGPIADNE